MGRADAVTQDDCATPAGLKESGPGIPHVASPDGQSASGSRPDIDGASVVMSLLSYAVFGFFLMMCIAPMAFGAYASGTRTPSGQFLTEVWVLIFVGFIPLAFCIRALHRWLEGDAPGIAARIVAGMLCAGVALLSGFFGLGLWLIPQDEAIPGAMIFTIDAIGMAYFVWLAVRGVCTRVRQRATERSMPQEDALCPRSVSARSATGIDNPIVVMEGLKRLLDIGAISQEEYEKKKHDVLGRL